MKKLLLSLGLATACCSRLFAGETLQLQLVPDRSVLVKDSPQEVVVKIDLTAVAEKKKHHRTPLNLAVVLDKSGSMTGAKLEKTKQAAMQVVDRLTPDDVFSMVIFSDDVQVLVPAQHVQDKDALKEKIESIEAEGSTALYAGVQAGADQLDEFLSDKRINRVILLSDGLANVGPSTPQDLRRLGSRLAERGISVTTIGVGDDYNEDLMAGLAEASDANYYYVSDTEKLPAIFAHELGELLTVTARGVRIEITCPDGVKPLGFIGRPEQFKDGKAVIKLSQFTGGQDRYLFLRCRVAGGQSEIARARVSYTDELDGGTEQSAEETARVSYSSQQDSDKSLNGLVVAQKELMLTAVAKDEAMAQADQGNYQLAAQILHRQNAALNDTLSVLPPGDAAGCVPASAAVLGELRQETNNLDSFGGQLENNQYNFRKVMQEQSFDTRNSKN